VVSRRGRGVACIQQARGWGTLGLGSPYWESESGGGDPSYRHGVVVAARSQARGSEPHGRGHPPSPSSPRGPPPHPLPPPRPRVPPIARPRATASSHPCPGAVLAPRPSPSHHGVRGGGGTTCLVPSTPTTLSARGPRASELGDTTGRATRSHEGAGRGRPDHHHPATSRAETFSAHGNQTEGGRRRKVTGQAEQA
jgi:hypothetical protein